MSLISRLLAKLFPRITKYRFEREALATMQSMSRQTHPKEAFGVLRGRHKGITLIVQDVAYQPFVNTTRSALARIDVYALPDMVGTFHSHPTTSGEPSSADKFLFRQHPGLHCILPYPYTAVYVYNHHGELLDVQPV